MRNIFSRLMLSALLAASFFVPAAASYASDRNEQLVKLTVKGTNVRLRSLPSTEGKIVGMTDAGMEFSCESRIYTDGAGRKWYRISSAENPSAREAVKTPGPWYICADFVRPASQENSAQERAAAAASFFDGEWEDTYSGRCYMTQKTSADGITHFEIRWADSAFADHVWTFSGRWQGKKLAFTDCRHTIESNDGRGHETVKSDYSGGKGSVFFKGSMLLWDNEKDRIGENCRFRKIVE